MGNIVEPLVEEHLLDGDIDLLLAGLLVLVAWRQPSERLPASLELIEFRNERKD